MDERDKKLVSDVADLVWDEMAQMRQYGFTNVEGDLRVKDGVLRADVRAYDPRPADFITLTFNVGDLDVQHSTQADPRQDVGESNI